MQKSTVVVYVTAMVLLCALVAFALYTKPNVRAGGKFNGGEVYFEATDPKP